MVEKYYTTLPFPVSSLNSPLPLDLFLGISGGNSALLRATRHQRQQHRLECYFDIKLVFDLVYISKFIIFH